MTTTSHEELVIQSGTDWTIPIDVYGPDGITPLVVVTPVLVMRRDLNPDSQLLARLDTVSEGDGPLTLLSTGHWTAHLPSTFTSTMPWGRGFFQMFGLIDGDRNLVASGVIFIKARLV